MNYQAYGQESSEANYDLYVRFPWSISRSPVWPWNGGLGCCVNHIHFLLHTLSNSDLWMTDDHKTREGSSQCNCSNKFKIKIKVYATPAKHMNWNKMTGNLRNRKMHSFSNYSELPIFASLKVKNLIRLLTAFKKHRFRLSVIQLYQLSDRSGNQE